MPVYILALVGFPLILAVLYAFTNVTVGTGMRAGGFRRPRQLRAVFKRLQRVFGISPNHRRRCFRSS